MRHYIDDESLYADCFLLPSGTPRYAARRQRPQAAKRVRPGEQRRWRLGLRLPSQHTARAGRAKDAFIDETIARKSIAHFITPCLALIGHGHRAKAFVLMTGRDDGAKTAGRRYLRLSVYFSPVLISVIDTINARPTSPPTPLRHAHLSSFPGAT